MLGWQPSAPINWRHFLGTDGMLAERGEATGLAMERDEHRRTKPASGAAKEGERKRALLAQSGLLVRATKNRGGTLGKD